MATADNSLNILIKVKNEAEQGIRNASKDVSKLKDNVSSFSTASAEATKASQLFAVGLTAIATAAGYMGKQLLSAAGTFEQSQIAFTTMLGSAVRAETMLNELAEFAKITPFELTGIEATAKQLLAMDIASTKIKPSLKMLGDISAGLNVPLERLALNFGQVKVQGKLTGRELRDFSIAGVPLVAELAKQLGVSKSEIAKMVSAGKIGFKEVEKAFISMTSEGGRFDNLMDKQSKSLNGMISNLKDAWDLFLRGEGEALLDWGKKFVAMAIDIVDNKLPKWIDRIKEVVKYFKEHKTILIVVSGVIMGALVPAVITAATALGTLALSLAPFLIAGAIAGALAAGIIAIIENFDKLKKIVVDTWDKIKSGWKAVASWFKSGGAGTGEWVKNFFKSLMNSIKSFFTFKWIKDGFLALRDMTKEITKEITETDEERMARYKKIQEDTIKRAWGMELEWRAKQVEMAEDAKEAQEAASIAAKEAAEEASKAAQDASKAWKVYVDKTVDNLQRLKDEFFGERDEEVSALEDMISKRQELQDELKQERDLLMGTFLGEQLTNKEIEKRVALHGDEIKALDKRFMAEQSQIEQAEERIRQLKSEEKILDTNTIKLRALQRQSIVEKQITGMGMDLPVRETPGFQAPLPMDWIKAGMPSQGLAQNILNFDFSGARIEDKEAFKNDIVEVLRQQNILGAQGLIQ